VITISRPASEDSTQQRHGEGGPPSQDQVEVPAKGERARSIALTGLFVLAIFYTIYVMRAILLPLVLAVLLSYLLRPIIRALGRARVPAALSSAIILIGALGIIGYGASYLAAPAAGWLQKAPYSLQQLQWKLSPLKQPMEKVAQASGEIEKLATPDAAPSKQTVEVRHHPITDLLVLRTPEFIGGAVLLLILLYFLLAYDGVFLGKLIRLLPNLSDKKRAVCIANEIEDQISRYLFTVTMINLCLGAAVGTAVGVLGLRNPLMWGALVAALNFVPYLGALTGIICVTLGAILSFNSFSYALVFPGVYLLFASLEGNFVTPWIMGKSLTLNPVLILLSLTFWGWMWGIAGVILAVPILATFKIFCSHLEPMQPVAEFLS
jgi:predicted PurR-regulated permease PerM